MQIVHTITDLRVALKNKAHVGFVPTMGNLHAGHLQLVNVAKQQATIVVVSIFVNPLQFGANEDLANYPRTFEADCEKLIAAGTDVVFAPTVNEIYPDFNAQTQQLGQTMTINPPPIAAELCGASRPGHFSGVATIVLKLFNIVQPAVAVFGKKDFQQLFIIRELVKQFNLPIAIIAADTVREPTGLAMSSRNGYLNEAEKNKAAELHQQLSDIVNKIKQGHHDFLSLERSAIATLSNRGWQVDYIAIRESRTLAPAKASDSALVVLGAAKLGSTRLIDNIDFFALAN